MRPAMRGTYQYPTGALVVEGPAGVLDFLQRLAA
jgi:hypothetical protein